jgi:hypothetical protein
MLLSYSLRLLCLALLGIGSLQAIAELLFWLISPRLVKILSSSGARRQEQALFWGQVVTHVLACLLTLIFLVPRYIEAETNLLAERVGYLSLAAAALVLYRYLHALQRGLRMWWRSVQLQREWRHDGSAEYISASGPCPPLALVGLFQPRILVAKAMLDRSKLSPEALSMALDHERAHMQHRDNWKLFALACLPRLGLSTKARPACLRLWQRHNDWAADDDAVNGSRPRALTLAESLVACAKAIPADAPDFLFTGFATHEDELEARIDRLLGLEGPLQSAANRELQALLVCAGVLLAATGSFLISIMPWLHEAAETILHLG